MLVKVPAGLPRIPKKRECALNDPGGILSFDAATRSAVAAEHLLCAIHIGRPDLVTRELLATLDGGALTSLRQSNGFWNFAGYRFRQSARLGIEGGAAAGALVGLQLVSMVVPPVGVSLTLGAVGWGMITTVQKSRASTREASEAFEQRYGFPPEELIRGKAWATDWWDLEAGDGLLEFILKTKWSPLWTDEQKGRLLKRLMVKVLSLLDESPTLKVMRVSQAIARARR